MSRRRTIIIIAILIATAATTSGLIYSIQIPTSPCASTPGTRRASAIIGDLNGFNGSRTIPSPWPVINAQRCDTIVINFVNEDPIQAHGLAVDFYSSRGVAPQSGETQTLTFRAIKMGQFRFFCHIFCTVHIHMQDGLLNVS